MFFPYAALFNIKDNLLWKNNISITITKLIIIKISLDVQHIGLLKLIFSPWKFYLNDGNKNEGITMINNERTQNMKFLT